MSVATVVDNRKLRAFISYSRKDFDFAQQIVAALEARNITTKIDNRDLPKLEDCAANCWGSSAKPTQLFSLSARTRCPLQSAHGRWNKFRLNKRLAPIVLECVSDYSIPEAISKINYIFFDHPEDFEAQADALAQALQTDLSWLKEHTRLGELARRWDGRRRPGSLLLRGHELRDGESWLAMHPASAPSPTELQREFIRQSRRETTVRTAQAAFRPVFSLVLVTVGWEGWAWLKTRSHLDPHRYQDYIDSTLPLHVFRNIAEQRISEYNNLQGVPEGNLELYRTFYEKYSDSPYGILSRIIYNRRVQGNALKTVFANSTSEELSPAQLTQLGCDDLLLGFNEISYRLGHCFCSSWGAEHFPNDDCDGIIDTVDAERFASDSLTGIRRINFFLLRNEYDRRGCHLPSFQRTVCKNRNW